MDSGTEIMHKHLDDHISVRTLEREYTADRSMICRWVKDYIAEGESSFIPKGHPENQFAALHTSKSLSELERLRLIVAKLEIENERLKKEELFLDFGLATAKDVPKLLDEYVYYYSPVQYKTDLGF